MPYNFAADSFHTKKLRSPLLYFKNGPFAFLSPLWGLKGQHTLFILGSLESL